MSEKAIEEKIIENNLTAPRIRPSDIDDVIMGKDFHRLTPTLTVCVITLANGFTVTGESACASPENYNAEIGMEISFANAREKIWVLEGYLLKDALTQVGQKNLRFGDAIDILKLGGRVAREGWNGKDQWLELQTPDEHSKMQQPYIYISPVAGDLIPWFASQSDMLARDWVRV
jgi:hypothetical protein